LYALHLSQSTRPVSIPVRGAELHAELTVPENASGLVVLGYPNGTNRTGAKHHYVSAVLNAAGLATLLCDLLTDAEESLSDITGEFRHDVGLLSARLTGITDWCCLQPELRSLPLGFLAAGSGAAAAFIAASLRPQFVKAIVARGGRLDLAWTSLAHVSAPVLLIAGEHDVGMRESYAVCLPHIRATRKEIAIIPRAGALFHDPATLDAFAGHAARWFAEHLCQDVALTAEIC
jgi:pimeloyl-ACP methyl ester carboxylesterase